MAAEITSLQRGDQEAEHNLKISEKSINAKFTLRTAANQLQIFLAKRHSRNRCLEDSRCFSHKLHIEGRLQPLKDKLSSVRILECKHLQITKDLEGGIDKFQTNLVQPMF
jgi:hypothetical protein